MQDRRDFLRTVGRYAIAGAAANFGFERMASALAPFQDKLPDGTPIPDPPMTKVANNCYVLWGSDGLRRKTWTGGSNIIFVTQNHGVVLIDSKNAGWGDYTMRMIKSVTNKPLTRVIVTHTHSDHTASIPELTGEFEVIAQEQCAKSMGKKTCDRFTGCETFHGANAKYLPKRTYKDRLTLFSGADRIELYSFGRAHTDGDTIIHIPSLKLMHPGDDYSGKHSPRLDTNNGASGVGYPKVLATIGKAFKNVEYVVPAHHDEMQTWSDMMDYRDWQKEWVDYVTAGFHAGKKPEDIAAAYKLPERFKDYVLATPGAPDRLTTNAGIICDELKSA